MRTATSHRRVESEGRVLLSTSARTRSDYEPRDRFPNSRNCTSVAISIRVQDEEGDACELVILADRVSIPAIADELDALARRLRLLGDSWKRVGVCATCGTHVFDADNPPPFARCQRCDDTRFEIVNLGGGEALRLVASGAVASPETSPAHATGGQS